MEGQSCVIIAGNRKRDRSCWYGNKSLFAGNDRDWGESSSGSSGRSKTLSRRDGHFRQCDVSIDFQLQAVRFPSAEGVACSEGGGTRVPGESERAREEGMHN